MSEKRKHEFVLPDIRDIYDDIERLRGHELGDTAWMNDLQAAMDLLISADTRLKMGGWQ